MKKKIRHLQIKPRMYTHNIKMKQQILIPEIKTNKLETNSL